MSESLHQQLLKGLEGVRSRPDGTVHTLHVGGAVIGEVCVGTRAVRLNLRTRPKVVPKGLDLSKSKSKTWVGGGLVVTDANVKEAKTLLAAVIKDAQPKPEKTTARRPAAAAA